jgi:hypothetical protein
MKRNALPLLICLLPFVALAQTVYESQDKDGPVFSDTPSPGAQPVDLPPANVIDNPTPAQQQPVSQPANPGYTSVVILSPQAQGTVHSNSGEFQISLALTPALQSGNAISISLDGTTLPTLRNSLQFDITSDEWQSAAKENVLHELKVAVLDDSGNTLITANPVRFYVHRASRDAGTHR